MIKSFCDVCGAEVSERNRDVSAKYSFTMILPPDDSGMSICKFEDLCPRCENLAQKVNVSALVMGELRRLMADSQEAPSLSVAPPPAPKGKAAKEKREILAAIDAYRQEHGPGSIPKLARLAKVGEGELRDMISCSPVPITTWRKVGKTLGVSGTGRNGGSHEPD